MQVDQNVNQQQMAMHPPSSSNLFGWGDGKLDWSTPGDELNRRTTLYSSGLESTSSIPTMAAPNVDDPDHIYIIHYSSGEPRIGSSVLVRDTFTY
ncbi:hypothetical protein QL285_012111 [Trifolium repens]|nr:hypothetical protein QL285_012111 [Trifolium repens]